MALRGKTFERCLGHEDRAIVNGMSAPICNSICNSVGMERLWDLEEVIRSQDSTFMKEFIINTAPTRTA